MGWADFFGDSFESGLNSMSEGLGLGDVSAVNVTQSQNGIDSSSGGSSWWEKGIEKAMPSIMGAAMKPKGIEPRAPAAPGGHAIQPNTSGIMKPFDEIRSMADDNPLENIHQWSNLFG